MTARRRTTRRGGTSSAGAGKRILISGMGGELGTRVAALLEELPWTGEIVGLDVDPPRGRLRRSAFHRIDPRDRERTSAVVAALDPHLVLHLGVYEPNARANPGLARARTTAGALSVLGAAVEAPSLEGVVVRSGIEIYGRRRGAPTCPGEDVTPDPTCAFGRSLLELEEVAGQAGRAANVPVTHLRLAPVLGPHVASPLGRYLRLPVVPVPLLGDPAFAVVHVEDAAKAFVVAARDRVDGPVNVVAPGSITPCRAALIGSRMPFPIAGPSWWVARRAAALAGAPLPDHLVELLTRGRAADPGRASALLGLAPAWSTEEVVKELYRWATVTHLHPVTAKVS